MFDTLLKNKNCKQKFWVEDLSELFCSIDLVPRETYSIEEQLNSATRLILLIFIVLLILNVNNVLLFFFLSLLGIIIIYYIQKKMSTIEKFEYSTIGNMKDVKDYAMVSTQLSNMYGSSTVPKFKDTTPLPSFSLATSKYAIDDPNSGRFCNDMMYTPFDNRYVSMNASLVGSSSDPRTKQCIIRVPPAADSVWRENIYAPRGINTDSPGDVYQSGYETYYEPYVPQSRDESQSHDRIIEHFDFPKDESPIKNATYIDELEDNPENLNHNLPVNYPFGTAQKDTSLNEYNKNLFTYNIDDTRLYRAENIEPVSSTINISYNAPVRNVVKDENTYVRKLDESRTKTMYHPYKSYGVLYQKDNIKNKLDTCDVGPHNVIDPRYNGYGTSYRCYNDPLLGQPRYYYDDVDAVLRPKFIARNNIDHIENYKYTGDGNDVSNLRKKAFDMFTDDTISRRTDVELELMDKVEGMMAQRRIAPIATNMR